MAVGCGVATGAGVEVGCGVGSDAGVAVGCGVATGCGVAVGCGGGDYCPISAVDRQQMGVFIGVGFGLSLYGQ